MGTHKQESPHSWTSMGWTCSSSLHSPPMVTLPNQCLLSSLPLISLPLSLAFLLPTASAVLLCLHPCVVLIWGTGHSLSPEASQVHAPSLHWALLCLQCTSKRRKAGKLPYKGSLCCIYILPDKKEELHELAVKACSAVVCLWKSFEHHKQKRPPGYSAIFIVTFWVQSTLSPLFLILSSLINGDTPFLISLLFAVVYL